jgi:hypothetical protein
LSAASGVGDVVLPLPSDVGVGDVAIVVAEESKINKVSLPVAVVAVKPKQMIKLIKKHVVRYKKHTQEPDDAT